VDSSDLKHLGAGSARDRLSFRLVLRILLRCVPLLRGVLPHLAALLAGWSGLLLLVLPTVLMLLDLVWTRALQGEALTSLQAKLLGLDPGAAVGVEELSAPLRRAVAARASAAAIAIFLPLTAVGLALYYYQIWILQRVNQSLRVRLVDRLQALSLRFHAGSRVGDAIYRVYQDSAMVTGLIDVLLLAPLGSLSRYAIAIAVVALFDWRSALLLATALPALLLVGLFFSRRLRVGFRHAREANSALTSRIQESVAGVKVIKAFRIERFEQERFERASLRAFSEALRARSLLALYGVSVFWVLGAILLGSIALATVATRDAAAPLLAQLTGSALAERAAAVLGLGVWTLGAYNGFKWTFGLGTGGMRRLFYVWGRTQDMVIGMDRVFELLDLEPEVKDLPGAIPMPAFRSTIEFKDVSFGYDRERSVLEDVSLVARAGTVTAIVGPTGSGKSTLMALLLRLFDPDRGSIRIDGNELRAFRVESLRSRIAIALQENLLFGTTVRENIRYAVPDATEKEVREAARIACAAEFIERLPEGYDTLLGERGMKLSTGQRQRLSIARAVLKGAPILVLDEPTASLDAETELRVLRNLALWGEGRAIFLVTHRLSTIRTADQIVVVDKGRVRECGTHEELMRREDGFYRGLVRAEGAPAGIKESRA
jgi:ABC-type multidrug transport system fused ATPase/permease subunit